MYIANKCYWISVVRLMMISQLGFEQFKSQLFFNFVLSILGIEDEDLIQARRMREQDLETPADFYLSLMII